MSFDPTTAQPLPQSFDPSTAKVATSFDPSTASQGPLAQPDWSKTGDHVMPSTTMTGLITGQSKPKESWATAPLGMAGSFMQSVTNGLMMQPIRAGMEGMGFGLDKLKTQYPGQTDAW